MIVKFWKEILIVLLTIVVLISIRSCSINEDNTNVALHRTDSSFNVAHYYKSKSGELVGQVNTHELTIKQYKEYGEQLGFENKSLKIDNKKLKNLVAHWQGKVSINREVKSKGIDTTFIYRDKEVVGKNFQWKNKFLELDQFYNPLSDTLKTKYLYNVDFSFTAYRKPQKGFFKPPGQLVADIYFSDPNFKVGTFRGFIIKEEPKRWYQKTGVKIGLGALGGMVAYRYLVK